MAQGMDARQIGKQLSITENTTRSYIRSIREKLGVRSQLEAVVTAIRTGLVPAPE